MINPELKVGDRVILLHMEDEYSNVPPTTEGIVTMVNDVMGETIYSVKWDNGSSLNLISTTDIWKKKNEDLKESFNNAEWQRTEELIKNIDVFKYFNSKFLRDYLKKLRECSLVNMVSAAPYLYMGRDRIKADIFLKNHKNEYCDEVLEMANQAQSEMISGVIKFLEKNNKETNLENINRFLHRLSSKVLSVYILTF